jgi:hypothetical protein
MGLHYTASRDIIYRYKFATDFVNIDIKLWNTEMTETKNNHTGDLTKHNRFFFQKLWRTSLPILNGP